MTVEANTNAETNLNGNIWATLADGMRAKAVRFPSASKGLLSIFDQAIVSGTSFLTAAIMGRLTSPDELGLYFFILSVIRFASGIGSQTIIAPYMVYSKRRNGSELAEYGGSMWAHFFIATFIAGAGLLVAIVICQVVGKSALLPGLWALLGAGPLFLLREAIRRFSFANLQLRSAIALDAIVAMLQLGGLILLAYWDRLSIYSAYAVMAGSCLIAGLCWLGLERPQVRFVVQRIRPDWHLNWNFGKWTLRSYLIGDTTFYIALWVLSATSGAAATGIFGASDTIVGVMNVILIGVGNVLTPLGTTALASGGKKELQRVIAHAALFLGITLGFFSLIAILTGDWIVIAVFGSMYRGSGPVLATMAMAILMTALSMCAGSGLWAIDRPRANFVADVCCMIVTLISALLLIRPFGALGAAMTVLAGTTTACAVRATVLARLLQLDTFNPVCPQVHERPTNSLEC
jgi:O-antigen/teichoic acid export membrane protein